MATSLLHCQNVRFQITIYFEGNWIFFSIYTFMCALNKGANTSFLKKYFGNKLEWIYYSSIIWHETAVFTKHKHVILIRENSLKYSALQLGFALSYKWYYIKKILKMWWYPTMDNSARDFFDKLQQTVTVQFGELVCSIRVSVQKKVMVCRNLQHY
jgi:hypothetical protein